MGITRKTTSIAAKTKRVRIIRLIDSLLTLSANAYDFNMLSHPIWGKINPSAVPTFFYFLLNHLHSIDFEFGLVSDIFRLLHWKGKV